jgi:hypothetical protein
MDAVRHLSFHTPARAFSVAAGERVDRGRCRRASWDGNQ